MNGNTFVLVHAGLSNFSLDRDLEDYDISEMIFEKTGAKINVGLIVGSAILILMIIIFVKLILGFVMDFLFGRV